MDSGCVHLVKHLFNDSKWFWGCDVESSLSIWKPNLIQTMKE